MGCASGATNSGPSHQLPKGIAPHQGIPTTRCLTQASPQPIALMQTQPQPRILQQNPRRPQPTKKLNSTNMPLWARSLGCKAAPHCLHNSRIGLSFSSINSYLDTRLLCMKRNNFMMNSESDSGSLRIVMST